MNTFMKKTILIIFTVFLVSGVLAQDYDKQKLLSFEVFKKEISQVRISGFSGNPTFEDEDEGEFSAFWTNGNDVLVIKLETRYYPPVMNIAPYKFENKNSDFALIGELAVLIIDLPEVHAVLSIASNKIKDKKQLETIAKQSNLLNIKPKTVEWSQRIPQKFRLKGTLLETNDGLSSLPDFSYEVNLTIVSDNASKQSFRQLISEYGDDGGFTRFPDGIILNHPFSDIEDIDDFYPEHSEIRVVYYIP